MTEKKAKIHPSYDYLRGEWFTDCGLCARTLAELARQVRGGARRIEGYWPSGYPVEFTTGREHVGRPRVIQAKTLNQRAKAGRLVARERLIDDVLVKEFLPLEQIVVSDLRAYRVPLKKPRYAARYTPRNDRILDMWAAGARAPEIAAELGMRRRAVTQIVFVFRFKGDPRAVERGKGWNKKHKPFLLAANAR